MIRYYLKRNSPQKTDGSGGAGSDFLDSDSITIEDAFGETFFAQTPQISYSRLTSSSTVVPSSDCQKGGIKQVADLQKGVKAKGSKLNAEEMSFGDSDSFEFPMPIFPQHSHVTPKPQAVSPKQQQQSCLKVAQQMSADEAIQLPFREKQLIENLSVSAHCPTYQVLFYQMLNQGRKRGKETKILALDCERIETKKGDRLARISIINFYGNIVFDTLVKPWAKVTDYREWITGIKPDDLKHAPSYPKIAPILKKILNDKVVIGHTIHEDFAHLKLNKDEYQCEIRDVSCFSPFQSQAGCKRKLSQLAAEHLNAQIQQGHHSSIIDARASLALYRLYQEQIEQELMSLPLTAAQSNDSKRCQLMYSTSTAGVQQRVPSAALGQQMLKLIE